MKLIGCSELRIKIENGDRFILVNALEEHNFKSMHIPGSINLYKKEDILKYLKPTDEIVVYCTEPACNRSILLYYLLEALGYENVQRFAGGLKSWSESGYNLVNTVQSNIVRMNPEFGMKRAQ